MKILITGSEGFVGKNLLVYLKSEGFLVFAPTFSELDLSDASAVKAYLALNQFDVIVHCATTDRTNFGYPSEVLRNNLAMFFNLLHNKAQNTRLINLGSGSEYSREYWQPNMPETYLGAYVPADDHSYAKYLISRYIDDLKDFNVTTLRIFGIFGPYEDYKSKFISNCIAKNLAGLNIEIFKNTYYDYVYVDDFCRIVKEMLDTPWQETSYNVTSGKRIDLLSLARLVTNNSKNNTSISILNEGLGVEYSGCNKRIKSLLPNFSFSKMEDSVNKLYAFYQEQASSIEVDALKKDDYLQYAKSIQKVTQ
ncbi:NAD-dependent epimerase/dehydratase family protein [Pseudoalteromonas neustonica]|uniref:NAD-dependent epimerase/dehydratase family protein n=1 Tax=Pseudoalteromonas neustonica TaxID=1840331 RepID=UPI0007DAE653|nr:NAD-dependent epimerase/dehydratase family protein [Pseudoalteromonas neustonica]